MEEPNFGSVTTHNRIPSTCQLIFFGGDAMLKRLAVAMLCLYASGAYAQQAAGASGKPTDAKSYCQKMKSIEGLPEYATKLVAIRQAVVAAGKEDRTRIVAYFRPRAVRF
ncbi:MAG: hypothetical protein ACJ8AW_54965 [Rhodopila sp.]